MDFKYDNCIKLEVRCCTMEVVTQEDPLGQFVPSSHTNLPFVRSLAGIVTEVGSGVNRLFVGDEVVGILPIDAPKTIDEIKSSWLEEYFFVLKPKELSFEIATSCILDGVSAYTALHYQGRVRPGDTVLLCNAENSEGVLMAQLALSWGAKVLLTTSDDENAQRLRMTLGKGVHVFGGHQLLRNLIMDETGGLGVDCIVDNGVVVHEDVTSDATQKDFTKPTKYDILSSLSVNGRWITRQTDLQIDPPDSKILFLKGASIGYLFREMWLLSTFQQVNPADEKWCGARSLLHQYAERGCHQELTEALESGIHANISSIGSITPLHEAAYNGRKECVKTLIEHGANVNARNIENSTPLNEAVCRGHLEIAKILIENGAQTNPALTTSTPLHDAALSSQEECMELLLDHGADVIAQDCHYGTALHISCFKQNFNCVRILLNAGSPVNSQKMYLTPLHYATDGYHGESSDAIVKLLLSAGANCRMKSSLGRLPIDRVPPMSNAASMLNHAMYNPRTLVDLANICFRTSLQPIRARLDAIEWLPPPIKRKILLE